MGEGSISDASNELAEGIEEDDSDKVKGAAKTLGDKTKGQARKKKIHDLLNAELASICEYKGNGQNSSITKLKKRGKPLNPSQVCGMSESGNIDGDARSKSEPQTSHECG